MSLSIRKLREMLPPGTKFRARFEIGGGTITNREVVKCSGYKMESRILDGPKQGQIIHLNWSGVKADYTADGWIGLSAEKNGLFLSLKINGAQS